TDRLRAVLRLRPAAAAGLVAAARLPGRDAGGAPAQPAGTSGAATTAGRQHHSRTGDPGRVPGRLDLAGAPECAVAPLAAPHGPHRLRDTGPVRIGRARRDRFEPALGLARCPHL